MDNKYIFFRNDQIKQEVAFNPDDFSCLDKYGYAYFGRVLNLLESTIKNKGLVFYVTGWTVHELPAYGSNVVACILQDEWGREPHYRDKVKAVFKSYGSKPNNLDANGYGAVYDQTVNGIAYLKAVLSDRAQRQKSLIKKISGKKLAPIVHLPLGCYAYNRVDYIPFKNRPYDFYFNGSSKHQEKPFQIKRPKELARERMLEALAILKNKEPQLNIELKKTDSFSDSINASASKYLKTMMQTKFALVPRGANLETFRFYEALRFGCIPVVESFPKHQFYNNAPVIKLNDWSQLHEKIAPLLKQPDELEKLHKQTLQWWHEACSEEACSNIIANAI